jgi:hypothetical protein
LNGNVLEREGLSVTINFAYTLETNSKDDYKDPVERKIGPVEELLAPA